MWGDHAAVEKLEGGVPHCEVFSSCMLEKYCLAVLSKRQNPKCAMSLAYGMNTACYLHIRCDKYVYGSTPQDARQNRQRVDKCIGMQCTHCTHDNSASLKKSSMSMICVCVCSHVWACMCTCVWRPEVDVSCLPQSLPTLFFWGRVSRWTWSSLYPLSHLPSPIMLLRCVPCFLICGKGPTLSHGIADQWQMSCQAPKRTPATTYNMDWSHD